LLLSLYSKFMGGFLFPAARFSAAPHSRAPARRVRSRVVFTFW
jgi:hypothetical protein